MKTKRFLSILLSLALVLGMLPGMSLTAFADNTTTITPGTDDAKTGTGTMTITLKIKAAQTITADNVTATYGDTDKSVSASVTTPATGGGAITYAVKDGSGDYISVNESTGALTIKAVPPTDGKAYVIVTAAETDDYAETTKEVTVNISTKAMTVSASDVTATADGQPHGITVNVTDPATGYTVKYGTEEGSYTLDASPTQTEVGEKTVYYQVTADNYTTYTGSAKVTVSAKSAQTITASDVTATYGDTGKKIEASTTGDGGLSYAVKSGDAVTVDASGNLTIVKAGSAVITVTAAETDTYAQATKDVNVTVNTKAMTVSAEDVNVTVDGQAHGITVTVTDPASGATVKYGTEAGSYTLDASPTQTEVGEKTVYYQLTADNYTTYTGSAKVTVSAKQTQTITAADVTATCGDTGVKINASTTGDGGLSYAVKSGDAVTVNETTGALTIVKAGSAIITVTASETATYEPATKEVTVTINKANAVAATVTANNRTYDGTEKPLVTVTGEATGGEMQYALGTATEATQPYTTSIPTATDVGTYYVWYKAVGDTNHSDSAAACVTVSVSKDDPIATAPTGLTAAYGQTLADVTLTNPEGNTPGTWAWADEGTTSVGSVGSNTFKASFTPTDTANYNGKTGVDVTMTVSNKDMAVSAPDVTAVYDGQGHGITVTVTDPASGAAILYGLTADTIELTESPALLTEVADSPMTVYFTVSAPNYNTYTGSANVTLTKAEQAAPEAPTAAEIMAHSITLTAAEGCEYRMNDGAWQSSPVFTGLEKDTEYTFYQRLAETDSYQASLASEGTVIRTAKAYTVTWLDEDGFTIDTTTVDYGAMPGHDDLPDYSTNAEYFSFIGWTPEIAPVTGDAAYQAVFANEWFSYWITWENDDGTVLDKTWVEFGEMPEHDDPVKASDGVYTYTFSHWTPELEPVTGEATYQAVFTAEPISDSGYLLGDTNRDGTVDGRDVLRLAKKLAGMI